ncbi:hypothetical protein ACJMK2_038971 [Sinanodonta woodiana]|uniref:non-specific serine/threonine protein kinase n=1 Tax=Sinanodonta woodiana TaxID=1069815 RepID=A0ABD3WDX5_SINWO
MEGYTLKECLGKGAQAMVHIVERKSDHQIFVLKKVECFDESAANKAFKEAESLQNLHHPYVSGYRDFFVHWEKNDSSMYICILMDYFPNGDLGHLIQKSRSKKEAIPEEKIKKWLGEIIEALIFVHKKNTIHRDIRPSNIFLKDDGTLCLGDFSVATVLGDALTCTRASVSSLNYMPPECRDGKTCYNEKGDIWSLGCVLFELVTTRCFDSNLAISKLQEIKEEPLVLEEVFEDIEKDFSDDIISVLRSMLKKNHDTRPSAQELLRVPYIKSCVELSDYTQLEKRKRIQLTSTTGPQMPTMPRDQGVLKVVEYLASMVDFESCVQEALDYLVELSKQEEGLHIYPKGKKLIAMAMKNNLTCKEIQVAGCTVLNNLIYSAEPDDVLFGSDVIMVVTDAMETHRQSIEVQQIAATLLMAMTSNSSAAPIIGAMKGVQDLLAAMRTHQNDAKLCCTCLHALWGLTVNESNARIATVEKGVIDVCNVLKVHMQSPEVVEAACAALLALSLYDENLQLIGDLDCVGLLIEAIKNHSKNAKVVKNSCLALASLVDVDEESAYRVLTNEGPKGTHIPGIPIIKKTYELHRDNVEVVESIVTLFMELANYDDLIQDLSYYHVEMHLNEIVRKFSMNKSLICNKTLNSILHLNKGTNI